MKVCLLSKEHNPEILKRIQSLGHELVPNDTQLITPLCKETTDFIYLIPYECCQLPNWPQQRVLLARASRHYLVFGDNLSTHQIMTAARDGAHVF